ncbi:MAG: colanic acid biosynthesis glycosyltransferase WcaL [Chlorobium limicola]|uniref:glycosyltransferase n=1 Tax=Chlorobium limicola TaxID=1092 RepID=UPI0023F2CBDF|nr:glycosyltransferase [Chlorobium limicola]NTV20220.1 colanic acid biosynthesis glycosyltransferase WcaL [Chlorobium limicola]
MKENIPRILHISPTWLPLTQTWLYNQVNQLQKQMPYISVGCEKIENSMNFPIQNLYCFRDQNQLTRKIDKRIRKIGLRKHLDFYVKIGKKQKTNIIHSHFGNIGWKNIGISEKLNVRHIVTFYGRDVNHLPVAHPRWKIRYKELFKKADLFLCEGPYMANSLFNLGCPKDKIEILRLGVNISNLTYRPRIIHPDKPIKILIAASFKEKKGIPYAIDAIGLLSRKYKIELTIIGDAPELDKEKLKIIKSIHDNNLTKKTKFLGYVSHSEMLQESYKHQLFVQPSITANDGDTEGGAPVSIIEMLASGMPVISTKHCDIPDIVPQELNHLLAPEKDTEKLYQCMEHLINMHENIIDICDISRAYIEKRHNIVSQTTKLQNIYDNICR